jgi:hypothetical protein
LPPALHFGIVVAMFQWVGPALSRPDQGPEACAEEPPVAILFGLSMDYQSRSLKLRAARRRRTAKQAS